MPNHVHGIIVITHDNNNVGAGLASALNKKNNKATAPAIDETNNQNIKNNLTDGTDNNASIKNNNRATARVAPTIGDIVGAFKSIAANECLKLFKMNNRRMGKLWQRNYYEHIIRDNDELNRIRKYIINRLVAEFFIPYLIT